MKAWLAWRIKTSMYSALLSAWITCAAIVYLCWLELFGYIQISEDENERHNMGYSRNTLLCLRKVTDKNALSNNTLASISTLDICQKQPWKRRKRGGRGGVNLKSSIRTFISPVREVSGKGHGICWDNLQYISCQSSNECAAEGTSNTLLLTKVEWHVLPSCRDGHCFVYSVESSWREQLSHKGYLDLDDIKSIILTETITNSGLYLPFIETNSLAS